MERVSSEIILLAQAARIDSATGSGVEVGPYRELTVVLRVASKQGSPTSLDVKLQTSTDGTNFGDFKTAQAFTQVTGATALEALQVTCFGRFVRVVATMVGGGASTGWTFGVTAIGKAEV